MTELAAHASAEMQSGSPLTSGGRSSRAVIAHVIARMNVGGPAHIVSLLAHGVDAERYRSLVLTGNVGPGEASHVERARAEGADIRLVPSLGPTIHPLRDIVALWQLIKMLRRERPAIVHTHTAKAGLLGRIAALSVRPRPLIVHTYHGHVLEGYFSRPHRMALRLVERALARISDRLTAVNAATVNDLVRLGVASRERFEVLPIGLPLGAYSCAMEAGRGVRVELGVASRACMVLYAGRLVRIKRVDRMLRVFAAARRPSSNMVLVIAGEGVLRAELEALADQFEITEHVRFVGIRDDMPALVAAADIGFLTSDNEGTPVFLVEAAAGGVPAVATAVGGVPDIVVDGEGGWLAPPENEQALARALAHAASDPAERARRGNAVREKVTERFGAARLLADAEALYTRLLADGTS